MGKNTLCILCYKPASSTPNNSNFLLFLSKYLSYNEFEKGQHHVPRPELLLCQDCSKLGDSFTKLYLQLESLQLELKREVRILYEKMITSDYIPSRIAQFQKQFGSPDEEDELQNLGRGIKQLRTELINHCKLDLSLNNEHKISTGHLKTEEDENESDYEDIGVDDVAHSPDDVEMEVEPDENSDQEETPDVQEAETSIKSRRVLHKCSKCPKTFSTPKQLDSHLQTHTEQVSDDDDDDEEREKREEVSEKSDSDENSSSEVESNDEQDSDNDEDFEPENSRSLSPRPYGNWPHPNYYPPTQCETCLESFPSETALEKHRVVAHNLPAYIRCPGCGMTFPTFVGLRKHRARRSRKNCYLKNAMALQPASSSVFPHHVIVMGRKFCPHDNCNELFKFDSQLNIHLRAHGSWPCAHCGLMFEKAHDMAWHEVTTHNQRLTNPPPDPEDPNATYKCTRCKLSKLWNKRSFLYHFMPHHLGISPFLETSEARISCPICQKAFHTSATKRNLEKHMKSEHEVEGLDPSKVLKCKECSAYFKTQCGLTNHTKTIHKTERSYPCSECDKVYYVSKQLRHHVRTCHQGAKTGLKGNHECPICHEMYEQLPNLKRHIKSHENDGINREKGMFICEICSVVCTRKGTFRRHMKVKHGPPTHCCETCGKMFGNRDRLNQHIPSHNDGSNPLICHLCGASFRLAATLKVHLRKKHRAKAAPDVKPVPGTL
ncbi:putative zinc finger protein [Orchesella cincta]|uniref:Putative zinc finger protein n=1 Tax=Orchesella cincta TaxID=48709 RepID=A0A1D2NJR6_ORCCI|nr:putative zinc finger protein [Orchesella cincta]